MDPDSAIARQMKDTIRQSEAIRNAWVDAVSEGMENFKLQDGQKKDAQEGVIRYQSRRLSDDDIPEYLAAGKVQFTRDYTG